MSTANRVFYSLTACALLVTIGLGTAAARLLSPLTTEIGSTTQAVARWCLLFLTGSPEIDELLLLGLFGLLPVALLRGLGTLVQQWLVTERFVRARTFARRQRPTRRIARLCDRLGLVDRVDVVRAEGPYSFCHGLLRPRICLSSGLVRLLTEAEMEAVLRHERYHLQSHDPLKLLLARTLSRGFFFFPVVAELARHYATAKELAADRAAIHEQGRRGPLASALYKLLIVPPVGDTGIVAGILGATELRIRFLLDPQAREPLRISFRAVVTSAFVVLAIGMITLAPSLLGAAEHVHGLAGSLTMSCLL